MLSPDTALAVGEGGAPSHLEVEVAHHPLRSDRVCAQGFVSHDLAVATTPERGGIGFYVSNGAGVAAGDLTGNGYPDLVLARVDGPTVVLWNTGDLEFRDEVLATGRYRAVQIVDVDGDGRLDVVLTSGLGSPEWWRNAGPDQDGGALLEPQPLPGVRRLAYAMDWTDLSRDGSLDLVVASYDAERLKEQGQGALSGSLGGVHAYLQRDGRFHGIQLDTEAQSLAVAILDLDHDGWPDVLVGNDFVVPDKVWLGPPDAWQPAEPFTFTTMNTMSYDVGDVTGDGGLELFATDMVPYPGADLAPWKALEAQMHVALPANDPQVMRNILTTWSAGGGFQDLAGPMGVSATGWSWSGLLGDLDNDGHLDAYVVNGMIAEELFPDLPGAELVEENQALRNLGGRRFGPAPHWGLGSTRSGRGAVLTDLDGDGALDVVVNNLGSPPQLFHNQVCGGSAVTLDLHWPGSGNTRAIGARVIVTTTDATYHRDVRVARGYLSGADPRVHVGFPPGQQPRSLEVVWPDGAVSHVEGLAADTRVVVTRRTAPVTAHDVGEQAILDGILGQASFRDAMTRRGLTTVVAGALTVLVLPFVLRPFSRRSLPALMLVLAAAVQIVHQLEHGVQVLQAKVLHLPSAHGVLGARVDLELVHFGFNTTLFVALVTLLALGRRRDAWPRDDRWARGALWLATGLQGYHVVEHALKLLQYLTSGRLPAPGVLGHWLDLIWLHAGLNIPLTLLLLVAVVRFRVIGGGATAPVRQFRWRVPARLQPRSTKATP